MLSLTFGPVDTRAVSSPYRDSVHLQTLLAAVFAYPYPGDEARLLTRLGLAVGFTFSDPDLLVLLDGRPPVSGQSGPGSADEVRVLFGPEVAAAPPPDLRFSMNGETAHPFWTGELNMVAAMVGGRLSIHGPLLRALTIAPMMPAMQRVYRDLWAQQR